MTIKRTEIGNDLALLIRNLTLHRYNHGAQCQPDFSLARNNLDRTVIGDSDRILFYNNNYQLNDEPWFPKDERSFTVSSGTDKEQNTNN